MWGEGYGSFFFLDADCTRPVNGPLPGDERTSVFFRRRHPTRPGALRRQPATRILAHLGLRAQAPPITPAGPNPYLDVA
jgi:hypothetical protein